MRFKISLLLFTLGIFCVPYGQAQDILDLTGTDIRSLRYSAEQKEWLVTTGGWECGPDFDHAIFTTRDFQTITQTFVGNTCSHYGVWSPSGTKIASTGSDGTVRLWNALTGEQVSFDYTNLMSGVSSLSWRADETQLAGISGGDMGVALFDVATGAETYFPTTSRTGSVQWHPHDSQQFATVEEDGAIILWNALTGEQIDTVLKPGVIRYGLQWSPDGRFLATSTVDKFIIVEARSHTIAAALPFDVESQLVDFSWSADGMVFLGVLDTGIKAWHFQTLDLLLDIPIDGYYPTAALRVLGDSTYELVYSGIARKLPSPGIQRVEFSTLVPNVVTGSRP